jgi:hypothetical protein
MRFLFATVNHYENVNDRPFALLQKPIREPELAEWIFVSLTKDTTMR